ncbi:recombinase family protein [Telmatobacter sp. DSM 110680]|uniref:Recombinase family protein n=1 Tax=Telmatobacter sp. DSM 110680 TaxID=3036704 RepID=A0AAU7DEG2_9BACT
MSTNPVSIQSEISQNRVTCQEGVETPGIRSLRAAQYVRMSTDRQCYSIQHQLDAIALYAQNHRMVIVRTFADEGKSGLSLDGRAGLVDLFSLVQSGLADFKAILVYDVSRWGRFQDVDESSYWEYVCKRAGVIVHYCAEPFINNGSFSSVIFKALKRTMAAEYSRELSDKVFAGQCRLIELGYRQGGPVGFGLRRMLVDHEGRPKGILHKGEIKCLQTDRVVLVPGPEEELKIVHEIYHSFVEESKTRSRIANELNARGIPSGAKRPWSYYLVHEILINPKYIGANVYNRRSCKLKQRAIPNPEPLWIRREGAFPSIISPDMFERAAKIIESMNHRPTDDEVLDQLRSLLISKGRLSAKVINDEMRRHKSRCISDRFGSLRRAYEKLGYSPQRDLSFLDINRVVNALQVECINKISSQLEANGAVVVFDPRAGILRINGDFTLRLIIAKCCKPFGTMRWRIRPKSSFCDLTVIARMSEDNTHIMDYYLFPNREHLPEKFVLAAENSIVFDVYRFDNLDPIYQICRRRQVGDSL